jgi:hypothetical protein
LPAFCSDPCEVGGKKPKECYKAVGGVYEDGNCTKCKKNPATPPYCQ